MNFLDTAYRTIQIQISSNLKLLNWLPFTKILFLSHNPLIVVLTFIVNGECYLKTSFMELYHYVSVRKLHFVLGKNPSV